MRILEIRNGHTLGVGRGQKQVKRLWERRKLHVQTPRKHCCLTPEWPGWYVVKVRGRRETPRVCAGVTREPRDSQRRKALLSHMSIFTQSNKLKRKKIDSENLRGSKRPCLVSEKYALSAQSIAGIGWWLTSSDGACCNRLGMEDGG